MGHARTRPRPSYLGGHRRSTTRRQKSSQSHRALARCWKALTYFSMSILIVTHSNDNDSVALVAEAIARKGGHTIRFDTDRYPTEVLLTAYYGASGSDERLTLT